jgi:hypothetical protein
MSRSTLAQALTLCLTCVPALASAQSIWCGPVATDSPYSYASGTWIVPEIPDATAPGSGKQEALAVWVGIGGGGPDTSSNNRLIQTGVLYTPGSSVQGFWQIYRGFSAQPFSLQEFPVEPGDEVTASVRFDSSTGAAYIALTNASKDVSVERSYNLSWGYSGTTAEWIVEAAGDSGLSTPTPNFGDVVIYNAFAVGASGDGRYFTDGAYDLARSYDAAGHITCRSYTAGTGAATMSWYPN